MASFPISSIYFSFTSLIFIYTFLKESFLAAGDGTLGILSWDQISFCNTFRKSKERNENKSVVEPSEEPPLTSEIPGGHDSGCLVGRGAGWTTPLPPDGVEPGK